MPSRITARGTRRLTKAQRSAAAVRGWKTRRANQAAKQRKLKAAAEKRRATIVARKQSLESYAGAVDDRLTD